MSLRQDVLIAIDDQPFITLDELHEKLGGEREKIRYTANDCAKSKWITRHLDDETRKTGYKITPLGSIKLAAGDDDTTPPPPADSTTADASAVTPDATPPKPARTQKSPTRPERWQWLVRTQGTEPRLFSRESLAREHAMKIAQAGQRAEVFQLVRYGEAVPSAEWRT